VCLSTPLPVRYTQYKYIVSLCDVSYREGPAGSVCDIDPLDAAVARAREVFPGDIEAANKRW
jgi:hypothetical protein